MTFKTATVSDPLSFRPLRGSLGTFAFLENLVPFLAHLLVQLFDIAVHGVGRRLLHFVVEQIEQHVGPASGSRLSAGLARPAVRYLQLDRFVTGDCKRSSTCCERLYSPCKFSSTACPARPNARNCGSESLNSANLSKIAWASS